MQEPVSKLRYWYRYRYQNFLNDTQPYLTYLHIDKMCIRLHNVHLQHI